MNLRAVKIAALALLTATMPCFATWYEATGQAVIEQGNMSQARHNAVNDALHRAALFAGANVNSTQQMLNGVLQTEQLGVSSNGQVSQLQLMSETRTGNVLTVVIRANITAQLTSCEGEQFRKPVLLSQVQLLARKDAIYGQLFQLGEDTTQQLSYHLRDYSPAINITLAPQIIPLASLQYPFTDQLFRTGAQYIITASINDLSLGETTSEFWQEDRKQRFFAINVVLYDLFEQSVVFQQEYRAASSWPYKSMDTPSSHSQAFWQTPFGQKINQTLIGAAQDIQQQLQCKPLLTSIAQVNNNKIMLNQGRLSGLAVGDELQLFQVQRHPTMPEVKQLIKSPIALIVRDVSDNHAWAEPANQALIQHIQPADIVTVLKSSSQKATGIHN